MRYSASNTLNNIAKNIADDCTTFAGAMEKMFWEVIAEAQQTRSRRRLRRELARLEEQETTHTQRLGQLGFQLLRDGIAVQPTPDTFKTLTELDRLRAEQRRLSMLFEARDPDASPVSWRRLEDALQTGEIVVHFTSLPDSSPWCGRSMDTRGVPGLCVAFKRTGQAVQPFTSETTCRGGDLLIILSPAASVSMWERWIAHGRLGDGAEENR